MSSPNRVVPFADSHGSMKFLLCYPFQEYRVGQLVQFFKPDGTTYVEIQSLPVNFVDLGGSKPEEKAE